MFARQGLLAILVIISFKIMNKNLKYLVQTTKKCHYTSHISKLKTTNRQICSISSGNDNSYPPVMGNIELDTHADTIVAGANCCIMSYIGRVWNVSPYYKYSASVFWRQPEYNQRTEYAGFIPGWRQNTPGRVFMYFIRWGRITPYP